MKYAVVQEILNGEEVGFSLLRTAERNPWSAAYRNESSFVLKAASIDAMKAELRAMLAACNKPLMWSHPSLKEISK